MRYPPDVVPRKGHDATVDTLISDLLGSFNGPGHQRERPECCGLLFLHPAHATSFWITRWISEISTNCILLIKLITVICSKQIISVTILLILCRGYQLVQRMQLASLVQPVYWHLWSLQTLAAWLCIPVLTNEISRTGFRKVIWKAISSDSWSCKKDLWKEILTTLCA